MSETGTAWETKLLALACEAMAAAESPFEVEAAPSVLERAIAHCEKITSHHSRTFYFASALLPREKRRALRALYGFCRVTDDIVDRPEGDPVDALERWRRRAVSAHPPADDLVLTAWTKARATYRVPVRCAEQLIEGVARDLVKTRYANFDELAEYCYGVASTVGLMSMHIIGFAGPEAVPYAVKMGVALQLTNILRDVGEDWRNGRVYLPQDELDAYGLGDEALAAGRVDGRWRALLRFQIERNRQLYDEAWPGIAFLHRDGQFAIAAAAELYRAILSAIEANDYDVFGRRAHVTLWGKLRRMPRIWRRLRHLRRNGPAAQARGG